MPRIPLFPLKTVLFPGMILPLRVFEARYLQMLDWCQAEGSPFGVVLIRKGSEVGEPAVPYSVGTTVRIVRRETADDGTLNVVVVGRERFRIRRVEQERPYLVGDAEMYPLRGVHDPGVDGLSERLRGELESYIEVLNRLSATVIRVDSLPDEPEILVWVVGIALQISSRERQRLLESEDIFTLLRRELELLSLEKQLLQYIAETQDSRDYWEMAPFTHWSPN